MNLPIDLKTRIYEHIGEVKNHLSEVPADEQREILQTLETHIYDALETRADGNPTSEMLEAIIAELDPPESYGTTTPLVAPPGNDSSKRPPRPWFFVLIGTLTLLFILIWLNDPFSSKWMSGEQTEDVPPTKQVIIEGSGWNDCVIGITRDDLLKKLGTPRPNLPDWLMRWDSNPHVDVVVSDEGICREVRFNRGFSGQTSRGIELGSSFEKAIECYGTAERVWTRDACIIGEWPSIGLALWTVDARVTQIIVRKPHTPNLPSFNDDPSVIGQWNSIDFVKDMGQFDPANRRRKDELFLKDLTFLPNGKSTSHWTWTKGYILNNDSWSRYQLKEIDGQTYLYMEWMSGDVTLRGQRPGYYVFERP